MEMVARMPLPFVHRLRDIRIKQIQEENRKNAPMANSAQNVRQNMTQQGNALDSSLIEELVDELG